MRLFRSSVRRSSLRAGGRFHTAGATPRSRRPTRGGVSSDHDGSRSHRSCGASCVRTTILGIRSIRPGPALFSSFPAVRATTRSGPTLAGVDDQALGALEFATVLERLADATATPYGAERARSLHPATSREEVTRRNSLTTEAVALLDNAAEPPLQGISDVRAAAS